MRLQIEVKTYAGDTTGTINELSLSQIAKHIAGFSVSGVPYEVFKDYCYGIPGRRITKFFAYDHEKNEVTYKGVVI